MHDDADSLRLLRRFVDHRDDQAFATVVRAHTPIVRAACRRQLRDHELIDDAVQETFIKLARRAPNVVGSVAGWLNACATSTAIDFRSRHRHRRAREMHLDDEPDTRCAQASGTDPMPACGDGLIEACLAELSPADRMLIIDRYIHGQTQTALAEGAGISRVAMGKRVGCALERLRRLLRRRGVVISTVALTSLLTGKGMAQGSAVGGEAMDGGVPAKGTGSGRPGGARRMLWPSPLATIALSSLLLIGIIAVAPRVVGRDHGSSGPALSWSSPAAPADGGVRTVHFRDGFEDGLSRWRIRHRREDGAWMEGAGPPSNHIRIVAMAGGGHVLDVAAHAAPIYVEADLGIDWRTRMEVSMRYRIHTHGPRPPEGTPMTWATAPAIMAGTWLEAERRTTGVDGVETTLMTGYRLQGMSLPLVSEAPSAITRRPIPLLGFVVVGRAQFDDAVIEVALPRRPEPRERR